MKNTDTLLETARTLINSVRLTENNKQKFYILEEYSVPYIQKLPGGGTNTTEKQFSSLTSAEKFAKDNHSWVRPKLTQDESDKIIKQAELDMDKSNQDEHDYKMKISGVPVTITVRRFKTDAADRRANPGVGKYMYNMSFDKQYKGILEPNVNIRAQNAKKLGLKYNQNTRIWESVTFSEGVEEIKSIVSTLKVGDKTNFGVVVEIGSDSITFKAKDLPKTKIPFNSRKMASKDFVLDALVKM